jgi:hypothetical protein
MSREGKGRCTKMEPVNFLPGRYLFPYRCKNRAVIPSILPTEGIRNANLRLYEHAGGSVYTGDRRPASHDRMERRTRVQVSLGEGRFSSNMPFDLLQIFAVVRLITSTLTAWPPPLTSNQTKVSIKVLHYHPIPPFQNTRSMSYYLIVTQ